MFVLTDPAAFVSVVALPRYSAFKILFFWGLICGKRVVGWMVWMYCAMLRGTEYCSVRA